MFPCGGHQSGSTEGAGTGTRARERATQAWFFEMVGDLRHSYATILLAAGEHPKVVQETLGHSSVQLTLDTYSHLLPDMGLKERAAARLDALLTATEKVEAEHTAEGENSGQNEEKVVSRLGIEPRTRRLRVCCSAS
jgi:hypothetical protein